MPGPLALPVKLQHSPLSQFSLYAWQHTLTSVDCERRLRAASINKVGLWAIVKRRLCCSLTECAHKYFGRHSHLSARAGEEGVAPCLPLGVGAVGVRRAAVRRLHTACALPDTIQVMGSASPLQVPL